MPLLPIDLQTLFSQMNQVGKEQAAQREVSVLHQSLQGSEMIKKAEQADNSVNETKQVGDGLEKVKEEGNKEGEKKSRKREKGKDKESTSAKENDELFRDPDLGQHIDIVG